MHLHFDECTTDLINFRLYAKYFYIFLLSSIFQSTSKADKPKLTAIYVYRKYFPLININSVRNVSVLILRYKYRRWA